MLGSLFYPRAVRDAGRIFEIGSGNEARQGDVWLPDPSPRQADNKQQNVAKHGRQIMPCSPEVPNPLRKRPQVGRRARQRRFRFGFPVARRRRLKGTDQGRFDCPLLSGLLFRIGLERPGKRRDATRIV